MKPPLVSILTPFKNSSEYLEACLDSILAQQYTEWELLIVDDHSTDDSYELVKGYAEKDPRITLLKNTGHGIIEGLKLAFQRSTGQFITRMDSDDIMVPQKLTEMSNQLRNHGQRHIALGLVEYFCDGTLGDGYASYETWLNQLTATGSNYSEIYKECVIPSPCWMVYREDLLASGAFNHRVYPEDYDLAFRFYEAGLTCIPSNETLHYWRDYETRTSRTDSNYEANHFLQLKLTYFLKLDYDDNRPIVLWGAGFKGKYCAKFLKKKDVPFIWMCNNSKKIGKHIYKVELQATSILNTLQNPQVIITVANKSSQKRIQTKLENLDFIKAEDYFFFC